MLIYPLSFLVLLTPLVFVHELGHFLFAKWFGVRVDTFSIGFGPKVFSKQKGETEYCFSAIPLGGYVKLYGQDPAEEVDEATKHRSFMSKPPHQRFWILLGGPLFNLIFAVFVFMAMLVVGEPQPGTTIGRVLPGSGAEKQGFLAGDRIVEVQGQSVVKWDDVMAQVGPSAQKSLKVVIERPGAQGVERRELTVVPQSVAGLSIYGESIQTGDLDGISLQAREPIAVVWNPASAAAKAGLKDGDRIAAVQGRSVSSFEEMEAVAASVSNGQLFSLTLSDGKVVSWTPGRTPLSLRQEGIYSAELRVAGLLAGSPAEKAGLEKGDLILALNQQPLGSFGELRSRIQEFGEAGLGVELSVARKGEVRSFVLKPSVSESHDTAGKVVKTFAIGIYPEMNLLPPVMVLERIWNPLRLVALSLHRTVDLTAKTFISIKKLFFREVSMQTLGGPLLIGKLAGDSLSRGLIQFLKVMALISISLGVFNLLPVPVLDGGHITLLSVEVLRGRPMGPKQTELVQQLGMSLIMVLLVVVIFNDVSRVAWPALQQLWR